MNSKRKFWTNIGSLALVAVLAVGGVIGVLSALNVQVSSTFSISYTAHNVHAIITGDYADSTGTQVGNLVNKADQTTQIVFNGDEDNGATKGFEDKSLEIKGPEETVDIHYIVRNTGSDPFGLTMIFNSNLEQSNMQVRYSVQYWNGQDPKPEYVYNQQTLSEMYLTEAGTDNCCAVVGMQFSVVNQVQNATLNATMNFDLDSTAEAPEPGPLLESWGPELLDKIFVWTEVMGEWHSGPGYGKAFLESVDCKTLTFDRFTAEGEYNIDGRNVIEGIEPIDVQGGKIFAYKVPTGEQVSETIVQWQDVDYETWVGGRLERPNGYDKQTVELCDIYILSKDEMRFNDDTFADGFYPGKFDMDVVQESNVARLVMADEINFKSVDTTLMTSMETLFSRVEKDGWESGHKAGPDLDLSGFDTQNVTSMKNMFNGTGISQIICSGWDTSSVTDMSGMFGSCQRLTTLDLKGWNTSSVASSSNMFSSYLKTAYVGSGWTLGDEIFPGGCDVQHV